jgi:hypothetical protein
VRPDRAARGRRTQETYTASLRGGQHPLQYQHGGALVRSAVGNPVSSVIAVLRSPASASYSSVHEDRLTSPSSAWRLYRLTMPRIIKTRTTNSETKVNIPQISVTLLLRTAASSIPKRLLRRLATPILPKQERPESRSPAP